jgi:hypothetical protein
MPLQMYLPQEEHPAYGVLRAIVKDYNDEATTMGSQTWLDSGRYKKEGMGRRWQISSINTQKGFF